MPSELKNRSRLLYSVVTLIVVLLLLNVGLIYQNGQTIERNKSIQDDAEQARLNTLDLIRNLHLLDLGLRGYALVDNPAILASVDSAVSNKDRIFQHLEEALEHQNYAGISEFRALKDSINSYYQLAQQMLQLVQSGNREEFLRLLDQDRGYHVWLAYKQFSQRLNVFESTVIRDAKLNHERAVRNSYLLQWLIFLLAVPSLGYMAHYASQTFKISDDLRAEQEEKNKILSEQNVKLDNLVQEKTKDVLTQNEEIVAQNEEIRAHNDQLIIQQWEIQKAKHIIEEQARIIQEKNSELTEAVEKQTQDLRKTNLELVEQNSRLEQFAYIISHNLRAPLARLKGLAALLDHSTHEERDYILNMLVQSSHDLDQVITDLSLIIRIQKSNTQIRSEVNLLEIVKKALSVLENEITQVGAQLYINIERDQKLNSLAPYLESIVYNLLSNAIKYRHPERKLEIRLTAIQQADGLKLVVSDNGLGIDLEKHRDHIFNLYKRFHLHVEGKGLGLYLVKTQVEALGGKIEVESTLEQGTTFLIFLKN